MLGVACEKYGKYADASATGLRTVTRTIPALHRRGLLRKQPRRDGPPVLSVPELMDMQADEALRRAAWLAHHKGENPQRYFYVREWRCSPKARERLAQRNGVMSSMLRASFKGRKRQCLSYLPGTHLELRQRRRAKAKSPPYVNDREITTFGPQ